MVETWTGVDDGTLALHAEVVRPEWIDYNGHMNLAYYVLAFDHATDTVFDHMGIGIAYIREQQASLFVLEAHVTYEREMYEGEGIGVTSQILGLESKRLVLFHRMYRIAKRELVATNELLCLNVDFKTRRAAPIAEAALQRLRPIAEKHARLPRPPQAGRGIDLARRRQALAPDQ
ncbi:MAG: thioesterase-like protein [Rhodospirillales bacterium]|nr:thioesterase-like protein [Rhodospirillales bacterium]